LEGKESEIPEPVAKQQSRESEKLFHGRSIKSPELNNSFRPAKIAGRLHHFKTRWISRFSQNLVTNIVQRGYFLEWSVTPPLGLHRVSSRTFSSMDHHLLATEIKELLNSGAIRKLDLQTPCFVSNLFLVPKKNGKVRPNLCDYMVTIDLNRAFYHVPLAPSQ
jgi:hypothetical protein